VQTKQKRTKKQSYKMHPFLPETTGAALLEIMKPPQSLPLQMAERLLELI